MTAIICTTIICATMLLCVKWTFTFLSRSDSVAQQNVITEEDLEKAYRDNPDIPDFQKVIQFINEEFSGVDMEENDG